MRFIASQNLTAWTAEGRCCRAIELRFSSVCDTDFSSGAIAAVGHPFDAANIVGTVRGQAIGPDVIGSVRSNAVCADVISAI